MHLKNETFNDTLNLCDESREDVPEFSERTPTWPSGMPYGYHKANLVLVFHIRTRRPNGEPCELCATFYSIEREPDGRRDEDIQIVWRRDVKVHLLGIGDHYVEQPVLVRIVEFGEQSQQGRELWVRSIVRLRSLEACLERVADIPESPFLFDKRFFGIGNRELENIVLRRGVASAFSDGHGVNQIVQSSPEVMDAISRDERPSIERRVFPEIDDKTVAATIGVTLLGDNVRVSIFPCNNFRFDGLEVFFGAAEFQQGTSELRTDHAVYPASAANSTRNVALRLDDWRAAVTSELV